MSDATVGLFAKLFVTYKIIKIRAILKFFRNEMLWQTCASPGNVLSGLFAEAGVDDDRDGAVVCETYLHVRPKDSSGAGTSESGIK